MKHSVKSCGAEKTCGKRQGVKASIHDLSIVVGIEMMTGKGWEREGICKIRATGFFLSPLTF